MIIKRTNTQLAENLEDAKTRLAEIQLRMESSRANDSSIPRTHKLRVPCAGASHLEGLEGGSESSGVEPFLVNEGPWLLSLNSN